MNINLESPQILSVNAIKLENIVIGKTRVDLAINALEFTPKNGHLHLSFSCGFYIVMDERGLAFRREVTRPNHDHDDDEHLMIHKKNGTLKWVGDWVNEKEHEIFRMPFGARKVDY